MRLLFARFARQIVPAAVVLLFGAPGFARAQVNNDRPVALSRITSVRVETAAGGVPRYFDVPAVLPTGRIFALRMPDRRLFSLDVRGTSMSATEVALPSSVQVPFAMSVDAGGRLLILDPSVRRVFRFTASGSALRQAGSFPVENGASALCAMHGRIFVYQPGSATPLTAYSEAGAVIRKFGRQFGSGSASRREAMSRAQVHCSSADRRLLVASSLTGEIQAYRETGESLWTRKLAGIVEVPVLDRGGGSFSMVSPSEGYHLLLSLTTLRSGGLLAQYGFRGPAQVTGFTRVHSRRIALANGAETGRQENLPGWLTSVGGGRAVSLDQSTGAAVVWRVSEQRR